MLISKHSEGDILRQVSLDEETWSREERGSCFIIQAMAGTRTAARFNVLAHSWRRKNYDDNIRPIRHSRFRWFVEIPVRYPYLPLQMKEVVFRSISPWPFAYTYFDYVQGVPRWLFSDMNPVRIYPHQSSTKPPKPDRNLRFPTEYFELFRSIHKLVGSVNYRPTLIKLPLTWIAPATVAFSAQRAL